ncbi:two-component sensor histidine kinase [Actinorhabdospora filicis]|uniref:histidine kinase n=1 Tax=Actinorhabdospora filicis TaxID=1785913 RepID=A0A9W6WD78_9ACTN|nr:sensor histidine kinase [Actinorhabdospora filicis]GLZ81336.1 two-component sensor histidine kinase [Actinorhabdospora filicis]
MKPVRGGVPAFLGRHERLYDTASAVLLTAFNILMQRDSGLPLPPWGWAFMIACHVPLLWRRKFPTRAFWLTWAGTMLAGGLHWNGAYMMVLPIEALYAVARNRPLWRAVVGAVAFAVPIVVGGIAWGLAWSTVTAILIATAAVILLALVLRSREAYAAEVRRGIALAERERIARDMHDIVAHNLAVMVALSDGAHLAAKSSPERAADAMRQSAATGREALAEMRRLLAVLRAEGTPEDEPMPGLPDLPALVDRVRASGLTVTTDLDPLDCPPGPGLALYRIAQEALTNVIKHAGSGAFVHLRLAGDGERATLEVTDDGLGAQRPGSGHGLTGMAERAATYGGVVEAGPRPGRGWRVLATLETGGTG